FVDAAVAADAVVAIVPGVDPDGVVVHVPPLLAQAAQRLAAVVAHLHVDAHDIDAVGVFRIDDDAGEGHGAAVEIVAPLPRLAQVGRAKDAAFLVDRFHAGIHDIGIAGRDGERDAAQILGGQAALQFLPVGAAVGRFVDGAFGPAV